MTEVWELSSDSNDTIIISNEERFHEENDNNVQNIVSKYISEHCSEEQSGSSSSKGTNIDNEAFKMTLSEKYNSNKYSCFETVDFINEDFNEPFLKRSKKQDGNIAGTFAPQEELEALQMLSEKYKPTTYGKDDVQNKARECNLDNVIGSGSSKDMKKKEKELQKQQKLEEKVLKKKQIEQEKIIKQALADANKNLKPTECMKFITVIIDSEITGEPYGADITRTLQEADVQYKQCSQIFNHTITWARRGQTHLMSDDGKLVMSSKDEDVNEMLLIMNCREFVDHVNNGTLCACIQSVKSVLINKKITLIIYGLESYKRFQKNQKQRDMRSQITDENEIPSTNNSFFKDFPKVSNQSIEYALTELQLLCSCSYRMIESRPELAQLVFQFTKAVAEIPYKLQRYDKFQKTDWFVAGDNRNCVRVDKNGNGLNRLWNQILTTFPLARLETAEAISSKYATVSALTKAYNECQSTREAELLLQDIPVRRAAGPLSSSRKIGPELSKKIYNFFTSLDADALL